MLAPLMKTIRRIRISTVDERLIWVRISHTWTRRCEGESGTRPVRQESPPSSPREDLKAIALPLKVEVIAP